MPWSDTKNDHPPAVRQVELPDDGDWGPAMSALNTERQRRFVYAMAQSGGRHPTRCYLEAGYEPTTNNSANVGAFKLAHDERILAAIREVSHRIMGRAAMAASNLLAQIVEDEDAKVGVRMKAAQMILNRTGLHETTEHVVKVEKKLSNTERIEQAVALAKSLGLDPKQLLGNIGITIDVAPSPPLLSDTSEKPLTLDDWTAA